MKKIHPDFSRLAENWPAPFVVRDKVDVFSGNMINPRNIANLDALGQGPKGRIRVGGKKIAYPVDSLIKWLEERSELLDVQED